MKKIMFLAMACAMFAACQQNGKKANAENGTDSTTVAADSSVYEGLTPAADVAGIRYRVALANDSTNGYNLTMTYVKSEKDTKGQTFNYAGKAELVTKTVKGKEVKAYKLAEDKGNAVYFKQVNDSTLRMVNDALEEAEGSTGSYDLKLAK